MSIASKSQTIYTGCADIRAAIREEDSTKGGGLITTLGDQIRELFSRRFVMLWKKTDVMGDDGEGNQVVIGTTFTQEKRAYNASNITGNTYINDASIVAVILPETCTQIGYVGSNAPDSGFLNCTNLTYINTENIRAFGVRCFKNTNIEHVKCNYVTRICGGSFANCQNLKSFEILSGDSSFTKIDSYLGENESCFYNCINLEKVHLPSTINEIRPATFYGCSKLSEFVINGDGLFSVRNESFRGCSSLVDFPVERISDEIGSYAFSGTRIKNGIITVPSTVTTIGQYAFPNITTYLYIPSSVTTINAATGFVRGNSNLQTVEWYASLVPALCFYNCPGITSLTLGEGVTTIRHSAFYGTTSLTSLTIPSTVTEFQQGLQYSGVREVIMRPTTPPTTGNVFDGMINFEKCYVPYSSDHSILNAYKTATGWVRYASKIYELNPDGTIPV